MEIVSFDCVKSFNEMFFLSVDSLESFFFAIFSDSSIHIL